MQKIFKNVSELTTRKDYDIALAYVKRIITEASLNGALTDPEGENDYIHEIGRIGQLCADYEDTYIEFEHLTIRKKSPRILEFA